MVISVWGALIALGLAIILILKKVPPTYAMIFGAIAGGLFGGIDLATTVTYMISGTSDLVSSILRIVTAGVLAGALIESGAAKKIADTIISVLGEKRSLFAMVIATTFLTSVGIFGDVAIITVSPIAMSIAQKTGYRKLGILMAMLGGVKAGNVISPNPNTIAAAGAFDVPLTSMMVAGIPACIAAITVTTIFATMLKNKGTEVVIDKNDIVSDEELPTLFAAIIGPIVTIGILLLRPAIGVEIDPMIALPIGGLVGIVAMKKADHTVEYLSSGLKRMSGVAMLLIGTGCIAGIISNSELKDVIIQGLQVSGLPGYLLAPISGIAMGAATASSTAGTTLAGSVFGSTILAYGVAPLAAGAMIHAGSFVFDGLPHGSFFHVSAGCVNMEIKERLKLIVFESLVGLSMVTTATILYGVLGILG